MKQITAPRPDLEVVPSEPLSDRPATRIDGVAQLMAGGEPICRWCKNPLPKSSKTRPREVHLEHARPRRTAIAAGRWTTLMDDALSLDEVAVLAHQGPNPVQLFRPARDVQAALNELHMHHADYPPDVVARLVAASARLLEAIAGEGDSAAEAIVDVSPSPGPQALSAS